MLLHGRPQIRAEVGFGDNAVSRPLNGKRIFGTDLVGNLKEPTDFRLRTVFSTAAFHRVSQLGLRPHVADGEFEVLLPTSSSHAPDANQGLGEMSTNNLFAHRHQVFGSPVAMNERAKIIGENVAKFREREKLSQQELATRIGARSQNTINAIEQGATQKSRYLADIARVLRVSLTDLDPAQGSTDTAVIPGGDLVGATRDLKVFGSVEAGEGALVISSEPVDTVRRSANLENVRGAYGVIVVGESMIPALRPGDTALVNPHLPARAGDLCIFMSEKDGTFIATIKEYVGLAKDAYRVKRYKPSEVEFLLKKKDWPRCHVVVAIYTR